MKNYLSYVVAIFVIAVSAFAFAWFPKGTSAAYDNACGSVPAGQAWCINTAGWTVITPETGTGTCLNSGSNYTGTCVAAADDTIASTFNATISGSTGTAATLNIAGGASPAVGQTVFTGTAETGITKIGTITAGTNPTFTIAYTGADNPSVVSYNSSAGNDATCASVTAASLSIVSTETLSSVVHPSPCFTTGQAVNNKARTNSSDWIILKKNGDWGGGIGTITTPAGTISKSGKSVNHPLLITGYGTGSRPTLRHGPFSLMGNTNATNCIGHNGSSGQYIAYIGLRCYDDHLDPNSVNYYGATVTGDVGVANCGSATIVCNITPSVPSFVDTSHYRISGAGFSTVGNAITAFTGTTVTTSVANSLAATGVKFQIITSDAGFYISQGGPTNFVILEDVKADYTTLFSFQENYAAGGFDTTMPFQVRLRRNMNPQVGSNGSNIFTGTNYSSQSNPYMLIEENATGYGGWTPSLWSRPMDVTTHGYYLHDPSVCGNVKSNIIAYQSADTQNRPGFSFTNNLFLGGSTNLFSATSQPTSSNCGGVNSVESYDVMTLSGDLISGTRTATAINAGASPTLTFDGSNMGTGMHVVDINNPGAIPNSASLSTATATGGTLSVNVVAGVRGNGVQTGDTILFLSSQGRGTDLAQGGIYLSSGPAAAGSCSGTTTQCYAGASTGVTISNASPAVIAEPSTNFSRSANEPFKFTGGTLPPEIDTLTTYCTDASGASYHIYPSTVDGNGATTCPGAAGNLINTSGSSVNATRQGSRLLLFGVSPASSSGTIPYDGVPATLKFGDTVKMDLSNFSTNPTTVSWVAPDRKSVIVADPIVTASAGAGNGTGQRAVIFNIGTAGSNTVSSTIGPNNLYISQSHLLDVSQGNGAINFDSNTYALTSTNNYAYNWSSATNGAAFRDFGLPGNTISPQLMNTYNLGCSVQSLPISSNDNTACFPLASIEYYDALNRGSNTFTGNLANNGTGGTTLTVTGGTSPSVGDTIFTTSGSNLPQYTKVVSGSAGTFTLTNTTGTIAGASLMFGSDTDYFARAVAQSKDAGWNSTWTAKGFNNWVRNAVQCGNSGVYAGAPACLPQ